MRLSRTFAATISLAAVLVPFSLRAATEAQAVEACAEALAQKVSQSYSRKIGARIDKNSSLSSTVLRSRLTVFHVDAIASAGGSIVARADCFVNKKGEVSRIRTLPLDAEDAFSRSRASL